VCCAPLNVPFKTLLIKTTEKAKTREEEEEEEEEEDVRRVR